MLMTASAIGKTKSMNLRFLLFKVSSFERKIKIYGYDIYDIFNFFFSVFSLIGVFDAHKKFFPWQSLRPRKLNKCDFFSEYLNTEFFKF